MSAERPKLVLSPVDCDGCGRCVDACRADAIKPGPNYIYVDWSRCDACGKCVDACDRDAIALRPEPGLRSGGTGEPRPADGSIPAGSSGPSRLAKARLWRPRIGLPGARTPSDPPAAPGPVVAWSLPEAIIVLTVAVLLQVAQKAALDSTLVHSLTENGILLARGAVLALYYGLQVAVLVELAIRRDVGFAEAFRLDTPPDCASYISVLAMLAGTWLFSMSYRAAAIALGWAPPASATPSLTQFFGSDVVGMILTTLVVVFLGPVVEELLLRGVVLGALHQRLGTWPGIIISALMFAALHGSLWSFLPLTVLGLALGRLATGRRSLLPAIALHVLYNAAIVVPALVLVARG